MDFASPLLQLVKGLWGLAGEPLGYVYNLKDNVNLLRKATEDLKTKRDDVKVRVESEEKERGAQRTKQVENWLEEVKGLEGEEGRVLQEVEEWDKIKCLSRCLPQNCFSSYQLGKRVHQMLEEVRALKQKGEFNAVTWPSGPPRGLEKLMDETVGLDISLEEVLKWLVDEKHGVIGLYGTGGVGKTALMKMINNKLSHTNYGFNYVIWVEVSNQVSEDSIQDTIRKRLHIQDENWNQWPRDEKVHHLCQVLTTRKFVLLIDNVWERLDLSGIGVPHPSLENGSKVVFTTRLKHVCNQMGANKTLEVRCLKPEEALKLFEKNVGKSLVDCNKKIQDLVKVIVEECKGLPLALITVGRAMARNDTPREWRHALTTLRNNPHKLPGMVEKVYRILELSYISLNDSTLQDCFLYCCLFPEDYPIIKDKLIDLWIGEGLLGDTDDVYGMRDEGESILGHLERACLLESGLNSYGQQCVKMHDVIRDMATWIAHDRGQRENKLLVIKNQEDMSTEMISKWREAEKVSIWGRCILNIDQTPPECSQLKTLFVKETKVTVMPRGFFNSMTTRLTVLDLSNNKDIESFSEGICNLINLRYLNLSATGIRELPREIKKLTRLRWLLLDDTIVPIIIPTGAIANLPLNVFSQWRLPPRPSGQEKEEEIVEELGRMQHLTDLSIEVFKSGSALNIFQSPNIQRSIRIVGITNCQDLTCIPISFSPTGNGDFSHLEEFYLLNCPMLREMEITQGIGPVPNRFCFPSLVEVSVKKCGLSDLSWLVHAPNLQNLSVLLCNSIEKIIGNGVAPEELAASGLLSRLESLKIDCLPKLTSICDQTLFFRQEVNFPSLVEVCVKKCGLSNLSWLVQAPNLQKLTVEDCKSMEKIIGDGFAREESELLSCLKSLEINHLPKLTSICDRTLFFRQEASFRIFQCPELRKLPLDSKSMRESFSVFGDTEWWAKFEWNPTAWVTLHLDSLIEQSSSKEEMTLKEAVRKMKDQPFYPAKIWFRPSGPSWGGC